MSLGAGICLYYAAFLSWADDTRLVLPFFAATVALVTSASWIGPSDNKVREVKRALAFAAAGFFLMLSALLLFVRFVVHPGLIANA